MSESPEAAPDSLSSHVKACFMVSLKYVCTLACGLIGAGVASVYGTEELTGHLLVEPEVAGFFSLGGVCYVGWSAIEFGRWRKKRRARRRAAQARAFLPGTDAERN